VLFTTMLPLAEVLEKELGEQLRYCGSFHFELEHGHAVGADHKALANIQLSNADRERHFAMVDEVFAAFEAWTDELLRYAQAHPCRQSSTSATWRIGGEAAFGEKAG